MRKIVSYLLLAIGFTLIGIGSYSFFEKYGEYIKISKDDLYTGIYKIDNDYAYVEVIERNNLSITLNDEAYEFHYDGKYYENDLLGLFVEFKNDALILFKDGSKIKVYYKEKN